VRRSRILSIFDLYSKRSKRERGDAPELFQYTKIPEPLRVQIIHIWETTFGERGEWTQVPKTFQDIHDILCREYGIFRLTEKREKAFEQVANFMLQATDTERVLDVIELTFKTIDVIVRNSSDGFFCLQTPDDAISELNTRFLEHGVGYQFESGQIIRVDSQLMHSEVVKPTLRFLLSQQFEGANEEFLSAHEHFRHQKYKECLNDCLKAFESILKSICKKRGWAYDAKDTAKTLLEIVFQQNLIPAFMQSHFAALRSTLEAGVPTVRNKLSGHGQGAEPIDVPPYIAAYALHLAATNILLLAEADKAKQ